MFSKLLTASALTAAFTFSSGAMAAAFVVDDFTVFQTNSIVEGAADSTTTVIGSTTNIFGGSRQMTLSAANNGDLFTGNFLDANINSSAAGALVISNGSGVKGTVSLLWDGTGVGAVDADVTVGGTLDFITMNVLLIDLSTQVAFTLTDTSNNTHTTAPINFGGTGIFQANLIDFTNAGVDVTHIQSMEMVLTGSSAWDGAFDFVSVDQVYVPEPSSIALIGLSLSLVGLQTVARKRKQA